MWNTGFKIYILTKKSAGSLALFHSHVLHFRAVTRMAAGNLVEPNDPLSRTTQAA